VSEAPTRRGVLLVLVVGLVALVCLLLGHRALKGRLEEQQHAKSSAPAPPIPDTAGVAGSVAYGDGSAAGGVRVSISWRDSAGRAGGTIALTGDDGVFSQNKVPWDAQVTEVRAESGPLAAAADAGSLASRDAGGPRVRVRLPGDFALAGLVRRAGDRAPVEGAVFEVAGARATSGPGGKFRIERIPWSVLREERPVVRIRAQGLIDLDWPLPLDAPPESYADLTILMEPSK
jgi:hypothetical protein